ncbi:glycosyltransferase family 2 protein [Gallaecimonas xiamenensis]|uniref:Family 2 glycosyl transferase n=1 Tax=Gallaecimonas xiamenensis 3-C-1 TaxID=745411 RepID=K2JJ92_9GAMM|nr:glycosyltransferase [Gallaecimonas xiamenensis]EKE75363.1 family 2 glycosyl transferase [Gallaecimonas xiamenensis 3-C-1]
MKLSIILATCNRSDIIHFMLDSISKIEISNDFILELLVIDQSFDDKTFNVIQSYANSLDILYIHALRRGLSHSRNIGLLLATGDIVCFGDDDCTYPTNLLESLKKYSFSTQDSIVGGGVYIPGTATLTKYTRKSECTSINQLNMAKLITSISIFINKNSIDEVGVTFDERLGLGAEFSSCEELDFVYRLLSSGVKGIYDPSLAVFHAEPEGYSEEKTFSYAKGHGAYCRKLLSSSNFSALQYVFLKFMKTLAKIPLQLISGHQYHAMKYFKGFLYGFRRYKRND